MSPTDAPVAERFRTPVEQLQNDHANLVKTVGTDVLADINLLRVRDFVNQVAATGKVIDSTEDRMAAQGLINFWVARTSAAARARDRKLAPAATFDEVFLAPYEPSTISSSAAAAERWIADLPEQDRAAVRRIVLRLVRLRGEPPTFEPVPAVRATLHDLDLTPELVDKLVAGLQRVGVVRILRTPVDDSAEGDRVSLRDPALMSEWPTLAGWLAERKQFRDRATNWDKGLVPAPSLTLSGFQQVRRRVVEWLTTSIVWLGRQTEAGVRRISRLFGLPTITHELLTPQEIEEARTYHDRNDAERRFIDQSRYWEMQQNERNRVLLSILVSVMTLLLVVVVAVFWVTHAEQRAVEFEGAAKESEEKAVESQKAAEKLEEQNAAMTETFVKLSGRPALRVCKDQIDDFVPEVWNAPLRKHQEQLIRTIQATGRLQITGDPDWPQDYVGSCFVVSRDTVLTTTTVAGTFAKRDGMERWKLRTVPGREVTVSVNFAADSCGSPPELFKVVRILYMDEEYLGGVALLQTSPLGTTHRPLPLAVNPPAPMDRMIDRLVYIVSYPAIDSRLPNKVNEQILGLTSGVKRVSPGKVIKLPDLSGMVEQPSEKRIGNDCTTMGGSSGGPLVDLETGKVIGVSFAGKLVEGGVKENQALSMWTILSNPKVRDILERDK